MAAQPITYVDVEEYLRREREFDERNEYFDGEIIPAVAATPTHALICLNVGSVLRTRLRGGGCSAFGPSLVVCVQRGRFFAQPDVTVVCGALEYLDDKREAITNPRVLIEVLSPSTRNYDRGDKSLRYRMLPSLAEYLLIEQEPVDVEHYERQADGRWTINRITAADAIIRLGSINVDLPVTEIYAGI